MVTRVALAMAALGAMGCAPRLSPSDAEAIERALTPEIALVSDAVVVDSVHLRLPRVGLIYLAEVEPAEDPAVRAEAVETLRALVEGHLLEVRLSRCAPRDGLGARSACVSIAGVGERLCVNAALLRLGLLRRETLAVYEFGVSDRAAEPWNGLPAEVLRRLPALAHDPTVWVTASGERYHRASCGSAKGASPLPLRAALRRGLEPCSRCRPPGESP